MKLSLTYATLFAVLIFSRRASGQDEKDKSKLKLPISFGKGKAKDTPPVNDNEIYLTVLDFAKGLDASNGGFHDMVRRKYNELMQEHSRRAYDTNLSAHSETKVILEDRFRVYSGLYDNLLIQDLVNRMGQDVAPKSTDKLFAYKLLADPIPRAETLATGTIYITTGLIAMLDNEAQLAYVLAHEAAHVHKDHWRNKVLIELGKPEFARRSTENAERVRFLASLVSTGLGAGIGAAMGQNAQTSLLGGGAGALGGLLVASLLNRGQQLPLNVDWNKQEEDEADEIALRAILNVNYDVKEIPKLYMALDQATNRDDRVSLGFLGEKGRIRERFEHVQRLMDTVLKDEIAKRQLVDGPGFRLLIAELKRDNGILAYHNDMLEVARNNLRDAAEARDTDPTALYYYAKVLKLVGRTAEEKQKVVELFAKAIETDKRNLNFGAYLHRAVALMGPNHTKMQDEQAAHMLEQYVEKYAQAMIENSRATQSTLPPHLETIYDYMARLGRYEWIPSSIRLVATKQAAPIAAADSPEPQLVEASSKTVQKPRPGRTGRPAGTPPQKP